jgi:hypothetical protein
MQDGRREKKIMKLTKGKNEDKGEGCEKGARVDCEGECLLRQGCNDMESKDFNGKPGGSIFNRGGSKFICIGVPKCKGGPSKAS